MPLLLVVMVDDQADLDLRYKILKDLGYKIYRLDGKDPFIPNPNSIIRWKKTNEIGWVRYMRGTPDLDVIFGNRRIECYQMFTIDQCDELEILETNVDLHEYVAKYGTGNGAFTKANVQPYKPGMTGAPSKKTPRKATTPVDFSKLSKSQFQSLLDFVKGQKKPELEPEPVSKPKLEKKEN